MNAPYRISSPPPAYPPEPKDSFRKRHQALLGPTAILMTFLVSQAFIHGVLFRYCPLTNNGVPVGQVGNIFFGILLGICSIIMIAVVYFMIVPICYDIADVAGKHINRFLDKRTNPSQPR